MHLAEQQHRSIEKTCIKNWTLGAGRGFFPQRFPNGPFSFSVAISQVKKWLSLDGILLFLYHSPPHVGGAVGPGSKHTLCDARYGQKHGRKQGRHPPFTLILFSQGSRRRDQLVWGMWMASTRRLACWPAPHLFPEENKERKDGEQGHGEKDPSCAASGQANRCSHAGERCRGSSENDREMPPHPRIPLVGS